MKEPMSYSDSVRMHEAMEALPKLKELIMDNFGELDVHQVIGILAICLNHSVDSAAKAGLVGDDLSQFKKDVAAFIMK